MKDIFERAEDKLCELGISNEENIKEKQSVIRELMKEAVRENADWMLMHIELEERIPL
jgi:TPP-dependent pyruvate/acetoin dehydrogenase alpha subunit